MARYQATEKGQGLFLTVSLADQLVPGTFEHTLAQIFDEKINLRVFDKRYDNDQTGATAIEPRILLKIILYCYSSGVISSRKIAAMCRTHLVAKALAENTEPHYTTISNFVSGRGAEIEKVFSEVLLVCHELKLIRGKLFAIDGCRLPSNASKEWSGTTSKLRAKHDKIKKMIAILLEKHRQADAGSRGLDQGEMRKLKRLDKAARRIRTFLEEHEERAGAGGEPVKSNVTDNESGKIKGPHGVIQGYDGLAVADSKKQIIVRPRPMDRQRKAGISPRRWTRRRGTRTG